MYKDKKVEEKCSQECFMNKEKETFGHMIDDKTEKIGPKLKVFVLNITGF